MERYPRLSIDLGIIEANYRAVCALCADSGIRVTGVVKGAGGLVPVARAMARGGCAALASSRIVHLETLRAAGIDTPLGLLRIPGPGEVASAVAVADWSLQSCGEALSMTAAEAARTGRVHGVVLMLDLGDLREGWFDDDGLFEAALMVEKSMPSLYLRGIGTNLGCYGSVLPGADNLGRLAALARRIEAAIGRKLEAVSGGATSSLPMLLREGLPPGISELRIGEGALCARDLPHFFKVEVRCMERRLHATGRAAGNKQEAESSRRGTLHRRLREQTRL